MNSLAAFTFGFLLAASVVALGALWIARAAVAAAREQGYLHGREAERAILRRELAAKARGKF